MGERQFEMKKPVQIDDGTHTGRITAVDYRDEPYKYVDVYIEPENVEEDIQLKYGCPQRLTPNTKFGKLLTNFEKIDFGEEADPEEILVGKRVSFQTLMEKSEDGTFAKIVDNSIKPIKETEESKSKKEGTVKPDEVTKLE